VGVSGPRFPTSPHIRPGDPLQPPTPSPDYRALPIRDARSKRQEDTRTLRRRRGIWPNTHTREPFAQKSKNITVSCQRWRCAVEVRHGGGSGGDGGCGGSGGGQ